LGLEVESTREKDVSKSRRGDLWVLWPACLGWGALALLLALTHTSAPATWSREVANGVGLTLWGAVLMAPFAALGVTLFSRRSKARRLLTRILNASTVLAAAAAIWWITRPR